MVDRRRLHPRYWAGELGHTVVDREAAARSEACTVEDLGSGTAIARMAVAAGIEARGTDFVTLVRAGDGHATRIWRAAMHAAALGVVNLVQLVAPEVVVIGGGVGRNGDLVLEPIRDALVAFGPEGAARPVAVTAQLGDDPGLIGAAAWATATGTEEPTRS